MRRETVQAMRNHEETRQALARAIPNGEATEEQRSLLEAVSASGEALTKALEAEQADIEKRESDPGWRDHTAELRAGDYFTAVHRDKPLEGRAAEVNQELSLEQHQMPYSALLSEEDRTEMRVDADTTVTASVVGKPRMEVLRRVFRRSDAAFCGVMMPTAPRGTPIYPVMTDGVEGGMANAGAGRDSEAATFTSVMIEPRRATANYTIRAEDAAVFQGLEEILRSDLRSALNKLMDDTVVSANDTAPNTGSIISHAAARVGNAPGAVAKIADFDKVFNDGIDGLYAYSRSEVNLLIGVDTQKFLGNNRHDETAQTFGQLVSGAGGAMRATTRVADPASNIQKAYRMVPSELRAYAPVWEGLELIRDPYTDAKAGRVRITAMMLFGFDIVRGTVQTVEFKLA